MILYPTYRLGQTGAMFSMPCGRQAVEHNEVAPSLQTVEKSGSEWRRVQANIRPRLSQSTCAGVIDAVVILRPVAGAQHEYCEEGRVGIRMRGFQIPMDVGCFGGGV